MKKKEPKKYSWYVDGRLLSDEEVEAEIKWFEQVRKVEEKKNETK